MDRLVIGLSNKKEMILDPFCGSGSTLVSSKKMVEIIMELIVIQNLPNYQRKEF